MKALNHKLIIYDSNCKVCSSLLEVVLKITSIPEAKVKAYKDLSPDLNAKVDPDKFKNVMALIDTTGGETIYGAEGIVYILSSEYKGLGFLLKFEPFYYLFTRLYKIQAYNRYIIATPKSNFQCDCFPDAVLKYRLAYIAITLIIFMMLTAVFGISLRIFFEGVSAMEAAGQILLIAGTGWVIQIILATIYIKDKALDYIGHLGSIMVAGLLILVPWMLFYFITGIENTYLPAISVLFSSAFMLYLHVHRVKHLEISQWWTVSWFLFLQLLPAYFNLKLFGLLI